MKTKKRYKRNTDDYTEQLEKEIHELKSLNKQLLRRIRTVDKFYKEEPDEQDATSSNLKTKAKKEHCPKCHEGELDTVKIIGRSFKCCNQCDYRGKAVKC